MGHIIDYDVYSEKVSKSYVIIALKRYGKSITSHQTPERHKALSISSQTSIITASSKVPSTLYTIFTPFLR